MKDNAAAPLSLQVQGVSPKLDTKENRFSFWFLPSVLMRAMGEDSHYVLDWGLGPSASKPQGRLQCCSRVLSISPSRAPERPNADKHLSRENNERP